MLFPDCGANVRRKTGRRWPGFLLWVWGRCSAHSALCRCPYFEGATCGFFQKTLFFGNFSPAFPVFHKFTQKTGGRFGAFFAGLGKIAKKGIEIEFFFVYNDTVVVLTHCAYCEWGTAP